MSKKYSFLPSKKFTLALLILIALIVGGYFLSQFLKERSTRSSENTTINVTVGDIVNNDADGDGLEDWEEALWGTNPLDADTDGDGVSDGEEIDFMRRVTGSNVDTDGNIAGGDVIARQLFTTYSILESQGELSEDRKAELSTTLAEELAQPLFQDPVLVSDLNLIEKTPATFVAYANQMQGIFDDFPLDADLIIDLFGSIETGGSTTDFRPIALTLRESFNTMMGMPVPADAGVPHAQSATAFGELALAFEYLTDVELDPLATFQAVTQIESILQNTLENFNALSNYFRNNAPQS
jgi:hypothetical protein